MEFGRLIETAVAARKNAYTPYSGFDVGAALLAGDGKIYTGCNIENAAYSPSICGERTAFVKAVSEGVRDFSAIAVAGWYRDGEPGFAYPCGVCRQFMTEFVEPGKFKVIVVKSLDEYRVHTLEELLPFGFGL